MVCNCSSLTKSLMTNAVEYQDTFAFCLCSVKTDEHLLELDICMTQQKYYCIFFNSCKLYKNK